MEVEVQAEADAPLVTLDQVCKGVMKRAVSRSSPRKSRPRPLRQSSKGLRRPSLASLRPASVHVVGEGVLFGAVSSHARRWGAPARPNGGLLLRVPLRGHPHLPSQVCNYSGFAPSVSAVHSNVRRAVRSRSPRGEHGMPSFARRANAVGDGSAARSNRSARVRREGDALGCAGLRGKADWVLVGRFAKRSARRRPRLSGAKERSLGAPTKRA